MPAPRQLLRTVTPSPNVEPRKVGRPRKPVPDDLIRRLYDDWRAGRITKLEAGAAAGLAIGAIRLRFAEIGDPEYAERLRARNRKQNLSYYHARTSSKKKVRRRAGKKVELAPPPKPEPAPEPAKPWRKPTLVVAVDPRAAETLPERLVKRAVDSGPKNQVSAPIARPARQARVVMRAPPGEAKIDPPLSEARAREVGW